MKHTTQIVLKSICAAITAGFIAVTVVFFFIHDAATFHITEYLSLVTLSSTAVISGFSENAVISVIFLAIGALLLIGLIVFTVLMYFKRWATTFLLIFYCVELVLRLFSFFSGFGQLEFFLQTAMILVILATLFLLMLVRRGYDKYD